MQIFMVNHARLSFWAAMLPAFVLLVGGLSRFGSEAGLWLYALFVLYALTAFVWINRQARRMVRPAMEALDERCDPMPLLELCQNVLRQNEDSLFFRVHEAYALILLGREEEGRTAAERAAQNDRLWKDPLLLVMYDCCLSADDPIKERVGRELEARVGMLPPAAGRQLEQYLLHRNVLSQTTRGTQELEQPLLERLEQAGCLREKVGAHLALGAWYAAAGDPRADDHLNYVMTHANRLEGARSQAQRLRCLAPIAPEIKDKL